MELVLEVRHGKKPLVRHPLGRATYVLGSGENSELGAPITIHSDRVKPNHAVLEYTSLGWYLTPRQTGVRLDTVNILPVNERRKISSDAAFAIADVSFQLVSPSGANRQDDAAVTTPKAVFDELVSDIQQRTSRDTERRASTGEMERDDPFYRQKILPFIEGHLRTALSQVSQDLFENYAHETLRRELVLRLLGHPGLLRKALGAEITEGDRTGVDRLAKELLDDMGIDTAPNRRPQKLDILSKQFAKVFSRRMMTFSRALLDKIVAESVRFSVVAAMDGVGPLEALMAIEDINEVMVVGYDKVFVEIDGKLVLSGLAFRSPGEALTTAQKIATRSNTSVEKQHPYRDARLPDGSRVNIVIDPIALSGTTITIRKFRPKAPNLLFLRRKESLSSAMASFLKGCVVSKKNILVAGGTGTGKTTIVNYLASMIPPDERIVTVEDTAELKISEKDGGRLPHVVTMQGVAPTGDSKGHSIRDLVHNALRMRPDRIIVGECRGGEAFDMLQAMNTGHEGSMTTLHANDPTETVARLENLVLSAGEGLPLEAIRYQVAAAIDFIVQLHRYADGRKKISAIAEVGAVDPVTGRIEVNPIFETYYNPVRPDLGTRFTFAGRTPVAIREIIDGGFNPRRLKFGNRNV
ncbi:ATPase, T2SS/T4P/T4SS family [Loktanella sp. 3ANDIMAR09]|uniref:ATPase, T2SS/T4P/T4SS family n=1 Tax=Loktanella sp. 3ANDIMAR09 TaxID=1225657 RepID=UPI0006F67A17|nr:ATPase, T2SS/T4P/T4SS family [Loktanella sp. 3ANDIMAR09]